MKNKDLRRFFENNPRADETRQFVRYDDEGKLFFKDFRDAGLQIVNKNGQSVLEVRGQTLSEIDESIRSANLIDPKFVAENNTYYRHIGPTGQIFDVSVSLTNVHAYEGNLMKAPSVGSVSLRFIPDEGYALPNSITVTNASYTWVEGVVVLTNAIGNVSITIVGEQHGPEPGDLTEFVVGQTLKGIAVDTSGLSDTDIDNWLDSFDFTSQDMYQLIEPLGDSAGLIVGGGSVAPYPTLIIMGQVPVYYAREQYVSDGLTIPKGWSYMDPDQQIAVSFSGQREVNFAEGAELTITSVSAYLAALNGIVLGAIEGEPAGGLTPFEVGDTFTQIKFNSDANQVAQIVADSIVSGQETPVLTVKMSIMGDTANPILVTYRVEGSGNNKLSVSDIALFTNNAYEEIVDFSPMDNLFSWDYSTLTLSITNGTFEFVSADSNFNGVVFGKAN